MCCMDRSSHFMMTSPHRGGAKIRCVEFHPATVAEIYECLDAFGDGDDKRAGSSDPFRTTTPTSTERDCTRKALPESFTSTP